MGLCRGRTGYTRSADHSGGTVAELHCLPYSPKHHLRNAQTVLEHLCRYVEAILRQSAEAVKRHRSFDPNNEEECVRDTR